MLLPYIESMNIFSTALWFQAQSFLIVCLMAWGLYHRRTRPIHIKTMTAVIAWDVLLILQIELTRSAIGKTLSVGDNSLLLNLHVGLAVACVLGYAGLVFTGRSILHGRVKHRMLHRRLGLTTALLRVLVLLTSFWAVPA